MQLSLELDPPRVRGKQLADACADKAARVADFDKEGAAKFIEGHLVRYGQQPGEMLVDAAKAHGYRPHDDRAYGPVFASLVRRGVIEHAGYCDRAKGHGTAGGRIWRIKR